MIKNIIFDLGNVLISFRPRKLLFKFTNNMQQINDFLKNIIGSNTWLKLDRGIISFEDSKQFFLENYPHQNDIITYFYKNWRELFAPIHESVEILKKLRKVGYKTYALSNFPQTPFEFVNKLSKYSFLNEFDGMVISYREKVIKPEPEIYEILLQRYQLIAKECLFIDDTENFCFGAEKLGINTILFNLKLDLSHELEKYGIQI